MLFYWISVFAFAGQHTLIFLGKSTGGIVLDCFVVLLTIVRLYFKHGWAQMKIRLKETVLEGVVIVSIGASLVYLWEFIDAPPSIQAIAAKETDQQRELRVQAEADRSSCMNGLTTQTVKALLLAQQRDAQQLTINSAVTTQPNPNCLGFRSGRYTLS